MTKNYKRKLFDKIKPFLYSSEAIVITGMRRTGKTFLLKYIFEKIDSTNKLFLDLENPLLRRLFEEENYEMIKKSLEKKGLNFSQKAYIFLDEIQWLKSTPSIVKYYIDHYQVKFFLTGSASFYLKNLFSESLAGRKFIFEIYPLDFKEFLRFKEEKIALPKLGEKINEVAWKLIEPLWQEYLEFGGLPQVVLEADSVKKEDQLSEIFTSYFQNEIKQLADFRKINLLRNFIILLTENIGSILNIQRFAADLGVSRLTIEEWLNFLEQTYLIGLISPYSKSKRIAIRKAKKIYFMDWALAARITNISLGQRLENCIFHLLRLKGSISFYQKKSGLEIDFILDEKKAFEVKLKARKNDFEQLRRLSSELSLKNKFLVSGKYAAVKNITPGFCLEE